MACHSRGSIANEPNNSEVGLTPKLADTTKVRIVEEIILLLLDAEEDGHVAGVLAYPRNMAIVGAVLTELALENRIDTDPEHLVLTNPTPLDDELLDPVLADIANEPSTHNTVYWLARLAPRSEKILGQSLTRLTAAGILKMDVDGSYILTNLVARAHIYPAAAHFDLDAVHTRIMRVLFTDEIPSPRDTIIVGLASVTGILEQLLSREEMQQLQERIETVSRLDLIGRTVVAAARELEPPESPAGRRIRAVGEIPMVPGLPLLGNSMQLMSDLTGFLVRTYRELGPIFRIRALGRNKVVLAGTDANLFMGRAGGQYLRTFEDWRGFNDTARALRLLVSVDGIEHKHLRKAMARGYSQKAMDGRVQDAVDIARRAIAEWPDNRPISLMPAMQIIIAEQVGQILTGHSTLDYFRDLKVFLRTMLKVHLAHQWPGFVVRLPRFRRAHARLMELYAEVRSSHDPSMRQDTEPDFIDDMLELHRVRPHLLPETDLPLALLGPYIAGLETSASACAFMLYVLLSNPDLHARVTAEADALFATGELTLSALRRLEVTHRVALETLRLYPSAPMLQRTVANSFEFAGFNIPAGEQLWVATSVPHFLPELFPEPERIDIDRFGPERAEHRQPGAYAPFGLGKHQCLGRGFAELQIAVTLATIAHYTELALEHPERPVKVTYTPGAQPHPSTKFRLVRHRR